MKKIILASLAVLLSTSTAFAQNTQQREEPKFYIVPPAAQTQPKPNATAPSAPTRSAPVPSANVSREQIEQAQKIYNSMTPQQKAALADEVGKQAGSITPQQKAALISRARAHYQSLSPQEKLQLKRQLLELGSKLPAGEREAYLKKLDPMR